MGRGLLSGQNGGPWDKTSWKPLSYSITGISSLVGPLPHRLSYGTTCALKQILGSIEVGAGDVTCGIPLPDLRYFCEKRDWQFICTVRKQRWGTKVLGSQGGWISCYWWVSHLTSCLKLTLTDRLDYSGRGLLVGDQKLVFEYEICSEGVTGKSVKRCYWMCTENINVCVIVLTMIVLWAPLPNC